MPSGKEGVFLAEKNFTRPNKGRTKATGSTPKQHWRHKGPSQANFKEARALSLYLIVAASTPGDRVKRPQTLKKKKMAYHTFTFLTTAPGCPQGQKKTSKRNKTKQNTRNIVQKHHGSTYTGCPEKKKASKHIKHKTRKHTHT